VKQKQNTQSIQLSLFPPPRNSEEEKFTN